MYVYTHLSNQGLRQINHLAMIDVSQPWKVKTFNSSGLAILTRLTSNFSSGWKKSGQLGWMSRRKSLNRTGTLNHIINIQEREIKSRIIESLIIKSLTAAAVQNDWWWAKINLIPFHITVWICHKVNYDLFNTQHQYFDSHADSEEINDAIVTSAKIKLGLMDKCLNVIYVVVCFVFIFL